MKQMQLVITSILASGLLVACSAGKNKTNVEVVQNMMDQTSLKAQDYDLDKGQTANRLPPEGTVAMNREHYPYWNDASAAERNLRNPLPSQDGLEVGAEKYRIYCGLCHGDTGDGQGRIAPFMSLKPPTLLSSKVRNFGDGRIFHIITAGQGVMGSYANQILKTSDRWAVVNYVRQLQKENGGN